MRVYVERGVYCPPCKEERCLLLCKKRCGESWELGRLDELCSVALCPVLRPPPPHTHTYIPRTTHQHAHLFYTLPLPFIVFTEP